MKKTYKSLLSVLGLTIIVFIIIVSMFMLFYKANKKINEYNVDSTLYTYFATQKVEYNSHLTFVRENDVTNLKIDKNIETLSSEPLYFKDEEKLILPTNMNVVYPLNQMNQKKVNFYSIIFKDNDKYTLSRDNKKISMEHTFLYDGNDLYIFLEDTKITIGDKEIEVSPLSYALCIYNDELYVYSYKEDKVIYFDLKEENDTNIYAKSKSYLVNINYDYVKFNETSILLNKKIDSLNAIN